MTCQLGFPILSLLLGFAASSLAMGQQKTNLKNQSNSDAVKNLANKAKQASKEGTFKDSEGAKRKQFNRSDCEPDKTVDIDVRVKDVDAFMIKLQRFSDSDESADKKKDEKLTCADKPSTAAKAVSSLSGFSIRSLFKGDKACQEDGRGEKVKAAVLCLYDEDKLVGLVHYSYSTVVPPTPALEISQGENKVILSMQGDGAKGITHLEVCYVSGTNNLLDKDVFDLAGGCPNEAEKSEIVVTNGQAVVDGLTNEVTYQFRAKARDIYGNESSWSQMVQGTPVELRSPLSDYSGDSNPLSWSCGCGGDANAPATSGASEFFVWLGLMTLMARRTLKLRSSAQGEEDSGCN